MRRLILLFFIFHLSLSIGMADTVKPWTFWYWMYGAVSEEGIRADLQAMKDVGLGGCYLMPIRGAAERPEYKGTADALTPQFWKMVDRALVLADSLGLDMGIHVCDGFALAGGPWITPAESMQQVVFCDTIVSGGQHRLFMPKPRHYNNYYEDIAVYAVPITPGSATAPRSAALSSVDPSSAAAPRSAAPSSAAAPRSAAPSSADPSSAAATVPFGFAKGPSAYSPEVTVNAKGVYCADKPCWLQYAFDEPTVVRSIEIEPSGTNIQCQRLLVTASDDGVIYHKVKQLTPPRQGWQNTGFNTTFSIPPTTARYFRFEWTPEGTEPGAEDLDAAKWKPVLRLKGIRLSSLALLDNWEGKAGYVWRPAPNTQKADITAPNTQEADITAHDFIRLKDVLRTTVQGDSVALSLPAGQWRILRMGHTSTGHTNATAGGAKGLECDKFSRTAVEKQIDAWFGRFMQRPNHRAIKYMHVDSWECGSQNWSPTFAQEFQRRRGYDLLPLMPVYAGVPIQGSEEVLRDIRRTINELVNEVFFTTALEKAHAYGVQLSSESVAPTMVSDGMEHYQYVDYPMGEFWLNSPTHDKPNDMLDAISGGHVYGKNIIQAEGFTELRGVWDETPAMVKPLLDRHFALGVNRLFFHVNTHNPWLDRRPGMTLDGIGLFFQRDQTWFPEAKAFVNYITRCQRLLQCGRPVIDIAVYTGDEIPCRALTPDRLVPMLPGLFGKERVAAEQKRLANIGQPMVESPVGVRHSAGIIDLKDWINPLHGYHYDSMNKDALLHQPFGYKVLVVPVWLQVSPEVKTRIEQLRQQGIQIIDKPYHLPTLSTIVPDVILPEGIAYCHRQTEHGDIYFLANQQDREVTFKPQFRTQNQQAVCYHPVNDEYVKYDNGTLTLPAFGSLFVCYGQTEYLKGADSQPEHRGLTVRKAQADFKHYTVSFQESGIVLKQQQLFDWSQHTDDRIRYFSGHVRYHTTFKYKEPVEGQVMLQLPHVKDLAHVWVNGHDCGIAWTAPNEVNITPALKKGKNTLEIEVVNTWHNALRGADQGKAPYDGIWTNAKYRTKGDHLLPAGLLEAPVLVTTTH